MRGMIDFILQALHMLIEEVIPKGRKESEFINDKEYSDIYNDLVIEIDKRRNWKIDFSVFNKIVIINAVIGYSDNYEEISIPLSFVRFKNGEIPNVPNVYIIESNFIQLINKLKEMRKVELFYYKISCA